MAQGFSLEITGLQQLQTYTSQLASNMKTQLKEQVTAIFDQGANRMRSDCPVRTGNLKKSITLNGAAADHGNFSGGTTAIVLAQINITAGYAGFVNFGTKHMKPRPFASNGYNFILSQLPGITLTIK